MNKQEFQQKIKDMKPPKFFTAITLGEAYEAGFEEAKGNVLFDSNFLDEPKKPVVPPYIDTWIQGCKYNGFDLLEAMTMPIDTPEKIGRWISDNPETFAKAWLYGYEVKKEKLYEVFLKRTGAQLGVCVPHGEDKTQFTKVELQEYDFDNLDVYEVEEVE